ncbi:MAG: hypothetical protein V5804_10445 [Mucilaginibacter sp.]|uniref:hypothetical protein n=1 Tax=Mucilaginibacter sp. TaxID=1882438 RepID=UPI0034E3E75C
MKNILWFCFLFLLTSACGKKETETTTGPANAQKIAQAQQIKHPVFLKDMFGVNAFEWDFLGDPKGAHDPTRIFEPKMELIKSFSGLRHYMDWEKLESEPGSYTFNPTHSGGWNYDAIYERCKKEDITVLACLKNCPQWLLKSYPENERDAENVPAPYGSNLNDPASYILQAKAAFQFAARYGSNKNVDTALVKVNPKQRWTGDGINQVKIGLNLVKYIECDNERDKTWKGKKAYQNPEQYAANLSAFYDGDKGKLGKNTGVKTADPNMQVVMGGLASPEVKYVQSMIDWCKKHRGYKPDGSVDLCFDVINYHYYANDAASHFNHQPKRGIAPELSDEGSKADEFVKLGKQYNLPVWVTEVGYDINPNTPQAAKAIGNKTTEDTQADWLLRTSLLFARHGISKVFFYMMDDVNKESTVQYSSSGLINGLSRRPSAEFILQAKNLMGNFQYVQTLSNDPLVDVYVSGKKKMYVLTVPDETGRTAICHLNLGQVKEASIYRFQPDTVFMGKKLVPVKNGKLTVTASERPLFVETN